MRLSLLFTVLFLSLINQSFGSGELTINEPTVDQVSLSIGASYILQLPNVGPPQSSTIYFLMTALSGSASFSVSPNDTTRNWIPAHKVDASNSQLLMNLTGFAYQTFFVKVSADNPSNGQIPYISIVATYNNTINLALNQPQFVQLHQPDITDFYFTYQWSDQNLTQQFYCSITNEIESNYTIYATFDGSLPSPSNFMWNSSSFDVEEWRQGVYWGQGSTGWPSSNTVINILVHLENENFNTHCPITVEAMRFSPSEPLLVHLNDGHETPLLHLRGDTYAHLVFNTSWITSQNMFLSIVKETGSVVVYVLSPDDISIDWPTPDHYTDMMVLGHWTAANSTTLQAKSAGVWRIVVINTQLIIPGSSTIFAVVASSFETPIALSGSAPVAGKCSSSTLNTIYSLVVADVHHDTLIYVRPADERSYFYHGGVDLTINTEPRINVNTSIFHDTKMQWNHSVHFGKHDQILLACDANAAPRDEPCILYIQVVCSNHSLDYPVNFLINAQRAGDIMAIGADDELPIVMLSQGEAAHYSIAVPDNSRPLHIAAYPCHGRAYLYASPLSRYPSNSSTAAFKSQNPNAVNQFLISQELLYPNGTTMYVSVKAADFDSVFLLRTAQYDPSEFTPLVVPTISAVQVINSKNAATDGFVVRWQPPTLASWIDPSGQYDIRYDVYTERFSESPADIFFTRCAWVAMYVKPDTMYNSTLTLTPDGYFEFSIDDVDATQQWVANVIATFVNRTSGHDDVWYDHDFVYTFAMNSGTGPTPDPDDHHHSDSAEIAEILVAVFVPLFLLAAAVAYYFNRRNKRLQAELTMQLPDIENLDTMVTPASQRRRGGRRNDSLLDNDSLSGL